jgi:hypothetical protein
MSASDISPVALDYTDGSPQNQYVPLADALALAKPPIAPSSGTGWRFAKATPILATTMVSGQSYTIATVGNNNWTAIGFAEAVIGTVGTYNGVAITGTTGFCVPSADYGIYIAWYPYNPLYSLSFPQTIPPVSSVKKNNLNCAWFLVRFNNDLAVQGYIAIQIETYAYAYTGNTTNEYTGRWAYSFPMNAIQSGSTTGWTAADGVALTQTVPRAVGGYTYLLYCEDKYPKTLVNQSGLTFNSGNGMFPSQTTCDKCLRDPYDIYPEYPHFALNAVQYSQNATQPTYPSVDYTDQADVDVARILFKSTSSPNTPQSPQPSYDFQIMAMGYIGTNGAGVQGAHYILTY